MYHFIIFRLKENGLQPLLPYVTIALNNDVKSIIKEHVSSDYKISTMLMSKHDDLQKPLFGEIVFNHDFHKN